MKASIGPCGIEMEYRAICDALGIWLQSDLVELIFASEQLVEMKKASFNRTLWN